MDENSCEIAVPLCQIVVAGSSDINLPIVCGKWNILADV
jgi:hypothetical protein